MLSARTKVYEQKKLSQAGPLKVCVCVFSAVTTEYRLQAALLLDDNESVSRKSERFQFRADSRFPSGFTQKRERRGEKENTARTGLCPSSIQRAQFPLVLETNCVALILS